MSHRVKEILAQWASCLIRIRAAAPGAWRGPGASGAAMLRGEATIIALGPEDRPGC